MYIYMCVYMCVRLCMCVRVRVCVCRYNYISRIIRDLYTSTIALLFIAPISSSLMRTHIRTHTYAHTYAHEFITYTVRRTV